MNQRFRIAVGSESGHEDLVGDLYFDDCIVLVLTQDVEQEGMRVEIFPAPRSRTWHFTLDEFEDALGMLKARMWELRRNVPGDCQDS